MNILITGASGAGKSTLARLLQSKGYQAYDTDSLKDLSAWIDRASGKPDPVFNDGPPVDWLDKYDWLWNENSLRKLLDKSTDKPTYFCGNSANQEQFYSLFDKIFLLEVNDELIIQRLTQNKREHVFGSRPAELEIILRWYKGFQLKTKKAGAMVIDAGKPLSKIVEEIIKATS